MCRKKKPGFEPCLIAALEVIEARNCLVDR